MDQFYIYTEESPWLIPLCLAGGALYAFVLYSKKPNWPVGVNRVLAGLRFALASLLLFLLLGPFIRYISNEAKNPVLSIALDNSASVGLFTDSARVKNTLASLQNLQNALAEKDIEVVYHTLLGKSSDQPTISSFTAQTTNLDAQLSNIRSDYEGRNLAGVVLISDGIVNQGRSPLYTPLPFPVYTVGLGDTARKRDISVSALFYNKVSYSGNNLPIVAELQHSGYDGKPVTVVLAEGKKVLATRQVTLPAAGGAIKVPFTVSAGAKGKRHYVVTAQPLAGEFTEVNNTSHAYIEVIEGKLKVLLAAAAPHPDIKAIKQALEKEENIEVEVYLGGINKLKPTDYDLAILHQIPSVNRLGTEALDLVKARKIPAFYVVGQQTDIPAFNGLSTGVVINRRGGNQTDQVIPAFNSNFSRFTYGTELQQKLRDYPPVEVPFADYSLSPGMEVILKQQVGSISTEKPLLAARSGTAGKGAVLIGDGIWEWRLREFSTGESAESFDKLFQNLVQLLTVKETRRRLNVYPVKDEFQETEAVQFEAEVYNNVYQKVYGQRIDLSITDEANKSRNFNFVNGEGFSRFTVGHLAEGLYSYKATAKINGKTETSTGEFVVQSHQLESLNSQADHDLLYQIAQSSGGSFFLPEQMDALQKTLLSQEFKPVLFASERMQDLINLKWIFFVLLALLSAEWFLRKFSGGY